MMDLHQSYSVLCWDRLGPTLSGLWLWFLPFFEVARLGILVDGCACVTIVVYVIVVNVLFLQSQSSKSLKLLHRQEPKFSQPFYLT